LFSGIRGRLISYYLAVIAVVVLGMGAFFVWFLDYFYMENLRAHLFSQARLSSALVLELLARDASREKLDGLCKELGHELGLRLTLVAPDGVVLGDSVELPERMENHLERPEIQEALRSGRGTAARFSTTVGEEMFYAAVTLPPVNGKDPSSSAGPVGFIRLALPLSAIHAAVRKLRLFILAALLASTLAALAVGAALSMRITVPLHKIAAAARAIAGGNFEPPLDTSGRDEIAGLARTIGEMGLALRIKVQQILLEKNKLDAVIFSMSSGIVLVDSQMRIELLNPAAEKMFQVSRETATGAPAQAALRYQSLNDNLHQVYADGTPRSFELNIYYPRPMTLQVSLVPVAGARGETVGVLSLFHDITSLRSLEQMRSEFAANVSHELRTPLAALKGYAETILDRNLDQEHLEDFLRTIDREADRLVRLVDALLDLSRIEEEKGAIQKEELDLAFLTRSALEGLEGLRRQKGIKLETTFPCGPVLVNGNADWLRQAIFNIAENSVKYGHPGGTVKVELIRDAAKAVMKITDDGPGIPAADLPHIFERFYRVDKARSRKTGGTGLGLAIVKHILEAHGASYVIESEAGRGATFRFTLPLSHH
jgi:two-component system phosphate regulon sensor histidine kinase PhoR